jgi:hypothetical protein
MFLGRLCWYTISESSTIDHAAFCRLLIENNIADILPPGPRAVDVFKRGCTANHRKRIPSGTNMFDNYWFTEVDKDNNGVWKVLVRETVDSKGHTVQHEQMYKLFFDRLTHQIIVEDIHTTGDTAICEEIIAAVTKYFLVMNNMLPPYHIREHIRKLILSMHATIVRPSGGVYFISERFAEKVIALENVVATLGDGSQCHSLPLLDDMKQRLMLKKAFEDESIDTVDTILGEMREVIMKKKTISSSVLGNYRKQVAELKGKVKEYSSILSDNLGMVDSRLEMMDKLMWEIIPHVK